MEGFVHRIDSLKEILCVTCASVVVEAWVGSNNATTGQASARRITQQVKKLNNSNTSQFLNNFSNSKRHISYVNGLRSQDQQPNFFLLLFHFLEYAEKPHALGSL